jgi:hypothetical protein
MDPYAIATLLLIVACSSAHYYYYTTTSDCIIHITSTSCFLRIHFSSTSYTARSFWKPTPFSTPATLTFPSARRPQFCILNASIHQHPPPARTTSVRSFVH